MFNLNFFFTSKMSTFVSKFSANLVLRFTLILMSGWLGGIIHRSEEIFMDLLRISQRVSPLNVDPKKVNIYFIQIQ